MHGAESVDVALWPNFAVVFESHQGSDAITLSMYFPKEPARDGTTYESLHAYVNDALGKSETLGAVAPRLRLVSRELAQAWEPYLDPDKRAQGPLGDFLLRVLPRKQYVFDAAGGIACDSVFLIKHGFQVFTNEVDELLADAAERYADKCGEQLQLTTLFWETLPDSLPGGMRFEAILCLGNSICLVEDAAGRMRCLEALRNSLRNPDDLLVIDERNFQYMLDHGKAITTDPLREFPPTTQGDALYSGQDVRGFPAQITPQTQQVKWRFFYNRPIVRSLSDIEKARLKSEDLVLHAFKHGELYGLLRDAGFCEIRTFADFNDVTPADNSMPELAAIGDVNFITYVAARGSAPTPDEGGPASGIEGFGV